MTAPDQASPDWGNPDQGKTGHGNAGQGSTGQGVSAGHEDPPTCYRHPERETWVSCVRCGRHACPDCLRQAAVGQQCVECVRGGARNTRMARTAFGGRAVSGAVVTWTLVAVNVLLFLVELAKPSLASDWGLLGYAQFSSGGPVQGIAAGQWYRLVTSAFLPPATGLGGLGFLDLAFNMWALIVVGPSLEQLLGRGRFITVYLLSALGGGVAFFLIGQPYVLALGASGAVFGLFGAWFVVSRKLGLDVRGIVVIIAINLVFSLVYRSTIAWQDHVGGLIVGALTTAAFAYAPRRNRTVVQVAAVLAIAAVLIVLVALRSHHLTSQPSA
jgi:membrane associated rhomboid family serine protease